ncbi:MAG: DUF1559 domain-containing protein [Planctomycetaceae bacterium]|nr:DUF1559 domain-containing protein [Planctomycetaceae bacterium]
MSASSNHTSGVNVALTDGSVQFISETVHAPNGNLKISGVSEFGVWEALGTCNGGEAASVP